MHLLQRDLRDVEGRPRCFLVPRCSPFLEGAKGEVQGHKYSQNGTHSPRACRGKQARRSGGLLTILFSLALLQSLSKT